MKQKNKQHTKQKVYIVLVYVGEQCRIDSVHATDKGVMRRYSRLLENNRGSPRGVTFHTIEKSVQGAELEDVIDLDRKSDIIKVSFIHSGGK